MNRTIWNSEQEVEAQIVLGEKKLANSRVTVGFDGFIDVLERPIAKTAKESNQLQYFKTIEAFGNFLSSHRGMSCSVELEVLSRRFGGNAPHLSNALAKLGPHVDCIGTFGKDVIDPVFLELPCQLYSFDDAGISTALEFLDGKVLLGERIAKEANWQAVEKSTASVGIKKLLMEADLLALVNWSEISYSYVMWRIVLEQYLAKGESHQDRYVFFDLCDVSRKSAEEIQQVLELIGSFSKYRRTVLSLNRNEAALVGQVLHTQSDRQTAKALCRNYGIDEVLVHGLQSTLLATEREFYEHQNCCVDVPVVLTGAGDNFNGATCAAILLGMQGKARLWFAAKFAEEYVKTGVQPTLEEMKTYARNQKTAEQSGQVHLELPKSLNP